MLRLLKSSHLFKRLGLFDGLFDRVFYLKKYPDLAAAGVNPIFHYLSYGAVEGRKPHPLFDADYYLRRNPQARDSESPILHFLERGAGAV